MGLSTFMITLFLLKKTYVLIFSINPSWLQSVWPIFRVDPELFYYPQDRRHENFAEDHTIFANWRFHTGICKIKKAVTFLKLLSYKIDN
jgi:hypothetical protein